MVLRSRYPPPPGLWSQQIWPCACEKVSAGGKLSWSGAGFESQCRCWGEASILWPAPELVDRCRARVAASVSLVGSSRRARAYFSRAPRAPRACVRRNWRRTRQVARRRAPRLVAASSTVRCRRFGQGRVVVRHAHMPRAVSRRSRAVGDRREPKGTCVRRRSSLAACLKVRARSELRHDQ